MRQNLIGWTYTLDNEKRRPLRFQLTYNRHVDEGLRLRVTEEKCPGSPG